MNEKCKLSIVIPCYNEEATLALCVDNVLAVKDETLELEIIIVDDGSSDKSVKIAKELEEKHDEIRHFEQEYNQGKGAALAAGFKYATGDFVAVQDADLEYDPLELKRLIQPIIQGKADVVLGSRFLSGGAHRVLYFWHSMGNKFLTFLSNMFTDLNLTDMETCYKVFKREVIQSIEIEEKRFGFEPEIVAKVAQKRLRIFEMGISYDGRTYQEGKKIGASDGFRALYCIFKYNAGKTPLPVQFLIYLFIGGFSAVVNLGLFLAMDSFYLSTNISAPIAFLLAGIVNYFLCIQLLFRHNVKWPGISELLIYFVVISMVGGVDWFMTTTMLDTGYAPHSSKIFATIIALVLNFLVRKYIVFPEKKLKQW